MSYGESQISVKVDHIVPTDRLYYLDWLRIFAILVVFLHHCSKIFDYHNAAVYNTTLSLAASIHREFQGLWVMPLFFVVSGAAAYFSLKSRSIGGFLKDKVLRIVIPLVFIGTFVINPPQAYLPRLFDGLFSGNFFQWYPDYFNGVFPFGNFMPLGHGTHLWYLMMLSLFLVIFIPIYLIVRKISASTTSQISGLFANPLALLLLFIPISAAAALFEAMGLGLMREMGHWDPLSYLLFFLYGYLIFSSPRIQETIKKYYKIFLAGAVLLTVLYLDSHFGVHLAISGVTEHDLLNNGMILPKNHSVWIAVHAFRGLIAWCWLIGLLGLGSQILNFNNKFLAYANEAVLPFYILHHTIIIIVGFFVIQWSSGVSTKYFAIAVVSFASIMAIYEILIRRVSILRILFGMKVKNESRNWQTALCVMAGLGFVLVIGLTVVSLRVDNMSPPPAKPELYINKELGFQLTFPASMNKLGRLTSYNVLFNIKHPKKNLALKIRQNAIPVNQPLDSQAGKVWMEVVMSKLGMRQREILSTQIFTAPDGTKVLYGATKFKTGANVSMNGTFIFFNRNGRRLFVAGYSEDRAELLEQIMKSISFSQNSV